MSISVRTRKMVNYACEGQSQGKLWWRLVAILTCISFVILGNMGERLIDISITSFFSRMNNMFRFAQLSATIPAPMYKILY